MSIKRIKVSNFKSFDELDVELRPFNLVVGANAAGKSNFLEIFRFLRDLASEGLANAVSLQGGMGYLSNLNLGAAPVVLRIEIDNQGEYSVSWDQPAEIEGEITGSTYEISFRGAAGLKPETLSEEVVHQCSIVQFESTPRGQGAKIHLGPVQVSRSRSASGEVALDISGARPLGVLLHHWVELLRVDLEFFAEESNRLGVDLLRSRQDFKLQSTLSGIGLFDLNPKLSKTAHSIRGRSQLDSDGGNLSIVLRDLLQNPERREPFLRLLRDLLPFAEDLRVDEFPDRSLLIALGERFSDLRSMPASFLSDGTLSLLALLVVLFFDDSPVVVIEEPEKNIHPHLISRLVGLMKEASRHKQLIVTTHNPQLLRHADLEDILLVQRDPAGFSRISRPADSQEVRTFVENDLGADELFIQNLLGVGNEA